MSGDVQPRKRKDKKRRKDEGNEQQHNIFQTQTPPVNTNDNVNIHVHKEEGTGGGICAKIVFFILFSTLAVLIGLIIAEHRGLTDLDVVPSESQFSQLFEGWIESAPAEKDHHDLIDDLDEEDILQNSDEHEEDDDDDDEDIDNSLENKSEDEEDELLSNENGINEDEEDEDEEKNDEEDEIDNEIKEDSSQDDDEEDEPEEVEESQELSDEHDEEKSDENDKDTEDQIEDDDGENDEVQEETPNDSRLAIKIGVGVALLVVAQVVLVKKRKSELPITNDSQDTPTNLSRRNTIVIPPTYQEVEQDIEETVEEDYSDEYEESESENEESKALRHAKIKYQELRSTYTRSLTPDSELDDKKLDKRDYNDEEFDDEDQDLDEDDEDDDDIETDEDIDDEELLQRLEARYGKLKLTSKKYNQPEQDIERKSDSPNDNLSDDEWELKNTLDEANNVIKTNPIYAIKLYDSILQHKSNSYESFYGKARALDILAEKQKSNQILEQAITTYLQVLNLENIPDDLFRETALRCINRMRFIGQYNRVIHVHKLMIDHFPRDIEYQNQLAISYLTMNRVEQARNVLENILEKSPNDGVALVHYGFILKTADNNFSESVKYLRKGIETKAPGVTDGRFYFHLGDALSRLGKNDEAMKIYEKGVEYNLFPSKYQRSLYNVARLKAQPWWDKNDMKTYKNLCEDLEKNWEKIRDEALSLLNGQNYFQDEAENLRDKGDWKQFELFARGNKNVPNCKKCPKTCGIIEKYPEAARCRRGQTKFSVMDEGTHVWAHCGPTNCRLRIHLGLKVPTNTFIRVGDDIKSWNEGKLLIFDDSFEHEVWHNGTGTRLVLIVDVWHPELTANEKFNLSPI